ncbi:hypothetical protein N9R79_11590 [Vibrio sp.]|nr:hypothetical protein [Vibrio sp.]
MLPLLVVDPPRSINRVHRNVFSYTRNDYISTHRSTGLSVRVQSERSQHQNKKLAFALLEFKLKQLEDKQQKSSEKEQWAGHWAIERGNSIKTIKVS